MKSALYTPPKEREEGNFVPTLRPRVLPLAKIDQEKGRFAPWGPREWRIVGKNGYAGQG